MKTQSITGGLFYDVRALHHNLESIVPMSHHDTSPCPHVSGPWDGQMHWLNLRTVITATNPMNPMTYLVVSSNIFCIIFYLHIVVFAGNKSTTTDAAAVSATASPDCSRLENVIVLMIFLQLIAVFVAVSNCSAKHSR